MLGAVGERAEMQREAMLRRPRIIRAGNQVSVDRPCRSAVKRFRQRARIAAGQAEAERKRSRLAGLVVNRERQPFGFTLAQGEAFARGSRVAPACRSAAPRSAAPAAAAWLVERAIAKRRDQGQPEAMQRGSQGKSGTGHWSISLGASRRRDNKKPRPDGGVLRI